MTCDTNLFRLILEIQPNENFIHVAKSQVAVSFVTNNFTCNTKALGTLIIIDIVRLLRIKKD